MLNDEDYKVLEESFEESQRLFNKLNQVAKNVENIYLDDSEIYEDEEQKFERHWIILSRKIVDALALKLEEYSIELIKNSSLDATHLKFNLIKDDEVSKIRVDYAKENTLSITQLS